METCNGLLSLPDELIADIVVRVANEDKVASASLCRSCKHPLRRGSRRDARPSERRAGMNYVILLRGRQRTSKSSQGIT